MKKQVMYMSDWIDKLDAFLKFNERDILNNPGKVSAEIATSFAESEFEKFRIIQNEFYESDFDRILKQLGDNKDKA